jgi:hypothetical protein
MAKYSNEQLREMIESEGLCYTIQNMVEASEVIDPAVQDAWDVAETALANLDELLDLEG